MSWWFQSNDTEKAELLLLVDNGPCDGFVAEVVRITKSLNLDGQKLGELLLSVVSVDNAERARKLVVCAIPEERLSPGTRTLLLVLFSPLVVPFLILRGLWRWWLRFFHAVVPQ